jgi:hypothetical protein
MANVKIIAYVCFIVVDIFLSKLLKDILQLIVNEKNNILDVVSASAVSLGIGAFAQKKIKPKHHLLIAIRQQ